LGSQKLEQNNPSKNLKSLPINSSHTTRTVATKWLVGGLYVRAGGA